MNTTNCCWVFHYRSKRKMLLYNLYIAKNPMTERRGGTIICNNVAYITHNADQHRMQEEIETSLYVDVDKEDRILRQNYQKIDPPKLNEPGGRDQQPQSLASEQQTDTQ